MRIKAHALVGRANELETALNWLWQSVRGTGPPSLVLVGEPGVGKSRLANEIADQAELAGVVAVRGRASATGGGLTLRPFAEALAVLHRRGRLPPDPLGGYRPLLARVLPQLSGPSPAGIGETIPLVAFAEAVVRVLTVIAEASGCLLVLEDLHDADPESLAVLDYLLDNLAGARVAILGVLRDELGSAHTLLTTAERRGAVRLLPIHSLGARDTDLLTAICLATERPPVGLVDLVWRNSAGNPLVVEELLYDMIDSHQLNRRGEQWQLAADPVLTPPPSILQLVDSRLARLSAAVRQVLITAAMYGEHFPLEPVLTAARCQPAEVLTAIETATTAQLLTVAELPGWYEFRHPLTHRALLELAGEMERRDAASRLADAVRSSDPELVGATCRVAARLLADAGNPAAAGELYTRAGRQALAGGAIEWAVADLTAAVRLLTPNQLLPASLIGDLVNALTAAGRLNQALTLVQETEPATDRSDRQQLGLTHVDLAWGCERAGRFEQARQHLATARCLAAGAGAELVQVHCEVIEACLELDRAGWVVNPAGEQLARAAAQAAEHSGAIDAACRAWYALSSKLQQRDLDQASRYSQRVARLADQYDLPGWRVLSMADAAYDSWLTDGEILSLTAARDHAQQLGMVSATLSLNLALSLHQVLVSEGSLAPVVARLTGYLEEARRLGYDRSIQPVLGILALAAAHRADRVAMTKSLAQLEAIGFGMAFWTMAARGASAICLAMEGRDTEALAVLLEVAGHQQAGPYYLSGPQGLTMLLATLAGATSPEQVAAALAGSAYRRWRWNRQFLHWAAAVHAGRQGDRAAANWHAAQAADDGASFPVTRHLAARLVAPAAAADGWGSPVSDLRVAEAWFHDQGVQAAARSCRDVLRTLGIPVSQHREDSALVPAALRAVGITTREYEVGLLVAEHLRNRAIADRLHISPRTVEKHIGALLSKLDVSDRAALIDRLADGGSIQPSARI